MEPLPNAELFLACACPQPRCIMQSWRSCGYLLLQLQQSPQDRSGKTTLSVLVWTTARLSWFAMGMGMYSIGFLHIVC